MTEARKGYWTEHPMVCLTVLDGASDGRPDGMIKGESVISSKMLLPLDGRYTGSFPTRSR